MVQRGVTAHSTPPPTVQPVTVPLNAPMFDEPGKKIWSVRLRFAKATPPEAKNSHGPKAKPARPLIVESQWLPNDSVNGATPPAPTAVRVVPSAADSKS